MSDVQFTPHNIEELHVRFLSFPDAQNVIFTTVTKLAF